MFQSLTRLQHDGTSCTAWAARIFRAALLVKPDYSRGLLTRRFDFEQALRSPLTTGHP